MENAAGEEGDCALARIDREGSVQDAMHAVRAVWGMHVTYHRPQVMPCHSDAPYVASTYPAEWLTRYLLRGYARIDPVVRRATEAVLPFDWSEIEPDAAAGDMLRDAVEHGLGPFGYTVPLRDQAMRPALFSLNAAGGRACWTAFLGARRTAILEVAETVHRMAQRELHGQAPLPRLSGREREVLLWAARGKTAEEISAIVGLTPHTIRAYQKSVRSKLNCTSLAQTVSCAIHLGLIRDPARRLNVA